MAAATRPLRALLLRSCIMCAVWHGMLCQDVRLWWLLLRFNSIAPGVSHLRQLCSGGCPTHPPMAEAPSRHRPKNSLWMGWGKFAFSANQSPRTAMATTIGLLYHGQARHRQQPCWQ